MNTYITHARNEYKAAGWLNDDGSFKDDMQQKICEHIEALLEIFSSEGHSGSTAPYTIQLFEKLARFDPICPLTGEDWEWVDVAKESGYTLYQNKRCGAVFKGDPSRFNGNAYFLDAVVFWDWAVDSETGQQWKSYYTSRDSMREITFPYTPETKYEYRDGTVDDACVDTDDDTTA